MRTLNTLGISPKLNFPLNIPYNEESLLDLKINEEDREYATDNNFKFLERYKPGMSTSDWYLSQIKEYEKLENSLSDK